jgi:hypothetical protein
MEGLDEFPDNLAIVVVCADGERSKEGLPVQPRPDEEFEGPDYTGAGPGASN